MPDYTVLSVDDDQPARVLYEIMLKRTGFEGIIVEDADEALAKLEEITPDLIMTDIQLPGMSGIELVAILRERPNLDKTAIAVLSAFHNDVKIEAAMKAGADEFIKKPLQINGLGEKLRELIEKRRGE